jgi:hypothetical protein
VSQATTFKTQLLESQNEADIIAAPNGSELSIAATNKAGDINRVGDGDNNTGDNFDSIDWTLLKGV